MNYDLNQAAGKTGQKASNIASLRKLIALIGEERQNLIKAFIAIFLKCRTKFNWSLFNRTHH